ncbi:GyrI-like domain-containing protein [Desulfovibrio sp. OttesenSCG-928-O18]|nr:GyrI-like domain-containing protein [Desulfovibrio sp. OttesenSCG-928-O18]
MFSITVVSRPALSLVGMCVRTTMIDAPVDCSRLWHETFAPRMGEFSTCCADESYGISRVVDEATGAFDYWAAVPVPEDFPVPAGMAPATLPAGLYAHTHVPSLDMLHQAYTAIFKTWLPSQKAYTVNIEAPSYERYPAEYLKTGTFELFFPVKTMG